ncbi:PiggyBac transposable element-derived protein 4 [Elysia marginata]|uniref:PiggyBac transposable element-derived protein 4 n=1 Tax=Elysia marginata TaxID=1093978 RepID=A0AAV4EUX9_9GAST|nr:PiggyBac transposable element-derived protein 4 [Elysia marginata]
MDAISRATIFFFTCLHLAVSLAKKKLTLVGTVRRNKTFLPKDFQEEKAPALDASNFLFRQDTALISYKSKRNKNAILMSTMCNKPEVSDNKGKPEIVLAYNKTKVIFFTVIEFSCIVARAVFR